MDTKSFLSFLNLFRIFQVVKVANLSKLVNSGSRLQSLVVDYSDEGQVFLYIADAGMRSIIVYEVTSENGFKVILPKAVSLDSPERDVLYLALVTRISDNHKDLYFTYLGSGRLFKMDVENLRSGTSGGPVIDVGQKPNKIVILGTDNGDSIFFREKGESIHQE